MTNTINNGAMWRQGPFLKFCAKLTLPFVFYGLTPPFVIHMNFYMFVFYNLYEGYEFHIGVHVITEFLMTRLIEINCHELF